MNCAARVIPTTFAIEQLLLDTAFERGCRLSFYKLPDQPNSVIFQAEEVYDDISNSVIKFIEAVELKLYNAKLENRVSFRWIADDETDHISDIYELRSHECIFEITILKN